LDPIQDPILNSPVPEALGELSGEESPDAGDNSRAVIGLSPVREALLQRGENLRRLYLSRGREQSPILTEILGIVKDLGHSPKRVPQNFFNRFKPAAHQGVAAYFEEKAPLSFEDFLSNLPPKPPSLILALDQVEDPGNLGALLRSAWGFGALGVLVPKDRSARLTPAAIKISAGGSEHVPLVYVTNLVQALETLKERGFWTVGAEGGHGESLFTFSFPVRTVLILGSEGKGMRRLTKSKVDFTVKIPLAKGVDSLNVASAGAVFMYAFKNYFDEN
jgi:23S rRNA (guanosine2251-2'-O)-methyltransferase